MEDNEASQGPISEVVAAFLEATFSMKLDNNAQKAKAKVDGIPDLCWIQCAKLDLVVSANVSAATRVTDRASSQIQNFWLDAATPLTFLLEKAEELELPEVIIRIQTSLQLMGNVNYQHSMDRRHALMMQLNHKLKQLFSYKDFKDAALFLFGEQFRTQAKDCLEAAEALRKTMASENSTKDFQKGHFQKNNRGGGNQYSDTGGS